MDLIRLCSGILLLLTALALLGYYVMIRKYPVKGAQLTGVQLDECKQNGRDFDVVIRLLGCNIDHVELSIDRLSAGQSDCLIQSFKSLGPAQGTTKYRGLPFIMSGNRETAVVIGVVLSYSRISHLLSEATATIPLAIVGCDGKRHEVDIVLDDIAATRGCRFIRLGEQLPIQNSCPNETKPQAMSAEHRASER